MERKPCNECQAEKPEHNADCSKKPDSLKALRSLVERAVKRTRLRGDQR